MNMRLIPRRSQAEKNNRALNDFLVHAGLVFFDGWMLMLVFGVLHASARIVPAFGYWQSTFTAWVVAGMAGTAIWVTERRVKELTDG